MKDILIAFFKKRCENLRSHWAGLLCLCACAGVIAFMLFGYPAEASNRYPSIFVNDKVFMWEENYPLLIREDDVTWVPIYVFSGLSEGYIKLNPGSGSFYITVKDKYLSFDSSGTTAISHDKKVYSINTTQYNFMRYIPLKQVCEILGVSFEEDLSKTSVRIYDSTAQLSFAQLLGEFEPSTTAPPATTAEPTKPNDPSPTTQDNTPTQQTTQPEDTTPHSISFAFAGSPGEATEKILDLLGERGVKAAFFLSSRDIMDDPEFVRRLVVDGHSIGVLIEAPDWEILLDGTEALLSAAAKVKPQYLLTKDSKASSALYFAQVYAQGYKLRQHPYTPQSYQELKARFLDGEKLCVLLDHSSNSLELMEKMFDLLDTKSYYTSQDYS